MICAHCGQPALKLSSNMMVCLHCGSIGHLHTQSAATPASATFDRAHKLKVVALIQQPRWRVWYQALKARPTRVYDIAMITILIVLSLTAVSVAALKHNSGRAPSQPVAVTKKAQAAQPVSPTTPKPSTTTPAPTLAPKTAPAPTHQQAVTTPPVVTPPSYIITNTLCQIDATQAPDQLQRAREMVSVCQTVFPQIEARLSTAPYGPLHHIVLDHNQYAAYTTGNTVHVSIDWLHNSPYDPGLIPHELTHIVQSYTSGPSWITEGIATYMSYKLNYSIGVAHCNSNERYTSGYGCAASLFNYIERVYQPNIVRTVHTSMKANNYSDTLFQTKTGKSLGTLYNECRQAECKGGTP